MTELRPIALATRAAFPDRAAFEGIAPPSEPLTGITLELVPVASLLIDPAYQRKITQRGKAEIKCIVTAFSWARFGAISVARMDDAFAVIDGQHRAIAAHILGIAHVPAVVSDADTSSQAGDFLGINTVRSGMQATDKFRARVAAGDKDAVKVAKMMENFEIDFDIAADGTPLKPRTTRSVSTVEKLAKRFGHGTVGTAIESLVESQPDELDLLSSFAIEATVILTARVIESEADLDRMDAVLQEMDFIDLRERARLITKASGGRTGRHGGKLLIDAYNKGRRNGGMI